MKIFISQSGSLSKQVGDVIAVWLKQVIHATDPFISTKSIGSGVRWQDSLFKELQDAHFGIICVTQDNQSSKWLNFEAGAISKSMDSSHVVPLLIDFDEKDLSNGPLKAFQASTTSKQDFKKLVGTINDCLPDPLPQQVLGDSFDMWWPKLEQNISTQIEAAGTATSDENTTLSTEQGLVELLGVIKEQNTQITSIDKALLDVQNQLGKHKVSEERSRQNMIAVTDLSHRWSEVFETFGSRSDTEMVSIAEIMAALHKLGRPINKILTDFGSSTF